MTHFKKDKSVSLEAKCKEMRFKTWHCFTELSLGRLELQQEYYRRIEAKLAEEELGIRSKKEPLKLTTPYITKVDTYTPGFLLRCLFNATTPYLVGH